MKKAFVLVFFLLHIGIMYNFCLLSMETVLGNASVNSLLVSPRYGFMRVPPSDLAEQFSAEKRISADFAQVYFPARVSSSTAYTSETNDPWRRPSRYAPLLHTVCHYTLCRLPYGYASLLHILTQLMLLYISFFYAFRTLHIRSYLLPSLLLANIVLFLTPVGLSWFERGQFSVYVSLAYLWLFLGIIKRNPYYLVFSALLAFIKWTSFPFIVMAVTLWLINEALITRNIREMKSTLRLALLIPLTIAFLLMFNAGDALSFLQGLYIQEQMAKPRGLSMAVLLPLSFAKSLPFILIAIGALYSYRKKSDYIFFAPYLCAAGILSVTYPTLAYDYSTPCLLSFVPLLAYWAKLTHKTPPARSKAMDCTPASVFSVRRCLPNISLFLFCFFLLTASVYHSLARRFDLPVRTVTVFYVAGAIGFFIVCALQEGGRIKKEKKLSMKTQTPSIDSLLNRQDSRETPGYHEKKEQIV